MTNGPEMTFREALEPPLAATLAAYRVPGAVILFARSAEPAQILALGTDAAGRPVTADTLFAVASITKLATALAVLRLVELEEIDLDALLSRYAPDAAAARPGVTIRNLLCHLGGLPLDLPPERAPYRAGLTWHQLARACLQTPLELWPEQRVQYSNVGYGLLAVVVERQTGQSFHAALSRLVIEPLGIPAYLGLEPPRPVATLADVRGPEADTPLAIFNSAYWRGLALPWAGLITTPLGVLALVRAYRAGASKLLQSAWADLATENQCDNLPGGYAPPLVWRTCWWGLGPDLRDEKSPHWAPSSASPHTFGHAGASGCCVWHDPIVDVSWAILGTRTSDNGWLLRAGPRLGEAILNFAASR